MLSRLEREALSRMPAEARDEDLRYERGADVRYVGQSWDIRVPIPTGRVRRRRPPGACGRISTSLHEQAHGYAVSEAPAETVHLAVSVSAPGPGRALDGSGAAPADSVAGGRSAARALPAGRRPAHVDAETGVVDVPVFHLGDLRGGDVLDGPALIDGDDSTTFVARGFTCRVGPFRVLHLVAL